MVIIYEILVFIDKNFHTYLVRDPYAFGNVLNYWWIIWSFHNNQSCPVLGWSTLLASMAVTALYRQAIQRYCFGDKYLNLNTINIWLAIHSKDQFEVMIERGKNSFLVSFQDIFAARNLIKKLKLQASHSTAQYFKLAGGLGERVSAVLVWKFFFSLNFSFVTIIFDVGITIIIIPLLPIIIIQYNISSIWSK